MDEEKPKEYWHAALIKFRFPDRWAALQKEWDLAPDKKPVWADEVPEITTRGAYFKAMRGVSGLSPDELAEAANVFSRRPGLLDGTKIADAEAGLQALKPQDAKSSSVWPRLSYYFRAAQTEFFDGNAAESLPVRPLKPRGRETSDATRSR